MTKKSVKMIEVNKKDKAFRGKSLADIMEKVALKLGSKYDPIITSGGRLDANQYFIDIVVATTECWDDVMMKEMDEFKRNVTRKLIPAVIEKTKLEMRRIDKGSKEAMEK